MTPSRLSCLLLLVSSIATAQAADPPGPSGGVLNLSASAQLDVPNDVLGVVLSTTRDGPDASSVQSALKQALEAALSEAKQAARPGQVEVQAGNFALYPRYSQKGQISGWQGSTELGIQGRDMPAIARLTGRIGSMTIARVSYSLSREQREKVESDLAAQAIGRYRAKAAEFARQFGYGGYVVRDVSVQTSEPPGPVPMQMMRGKSMPASEEALPVEPGTGVVSVVVSGSVSMR